MFGVNYLDGYIHHMVHVDTFKGILERRAILSKNRIRQEKLPYRSIAYEEVQSLRDRIFVWDKSIQKPRPLHSYVPFYFSVLTPMLYIQFKLGIQSEIIILDVNRSVIKDEGVLFTNGNASNQQLSKFGSEKVLIKPSTSLNPQCSRRYTSHAPQGSNQNCSDFYAEESFLSLLNWGVINDRWFNDEEKKRMKHAEVLYPDLFPLGRISGISVMTQEMAQVVNTFIRESGLEGRIPGATCSPQLYFS